MGTLDNKSTFYSKFDACSLVSVRILCHCTCLVDYQLYSWWLKVQCFKVFIQRRGVGQMRFPEVTSGLKNLRVLKTRQSSFADFVDDEYRTLPDQLWEDQHLDTGWPISLVKTSCWLRFGMFRHPAWAVGRFRWGQTAAVTVRTESTGGFYHCEFSPCTGWGW